MALKMFPRRANVPFSKETKLIHVQTKYLRKFRSLAGKHRTTLTVLFSYFVDNKNTEIQRTNSSATLKKTTLKKSMLRNSLSEYMFPTASVIMVWKHIPKRMRSKAVRLSLHTEKCPEEGEQTELFGNRGKVCQPCWQRHNGIQQWGVGQWYWALEDVPTLKLWG